MIVQPNPLVSVIVTTYRRQRFLEKTLESILSQTYRQMEIIIVDDGSGDSPAEVVNAFGDKRLRFLEIEHSGRPAVPRNFGLLHASGELIAFCDDDDLWNAQKISKQVKVFIQNPEVRLCYTDFSVIDEDDKPIDSLSRNWVLDGSCITFESQLLKNNITFSTVMIHKSVLSNGLKFDERPILRASEDYLFLNHIVYSHPVYYIAKPLVKYRIHQSGISYSRNSIRKLFAAYLRIIICMYAFFRSKKISLFKFIGLAYFHFIHSMKQILFPYFHRN
jgi:teichuronic acid biosynthesis glycosyltransferase TuaG